MKSRLLLAIVLAFALTGAALFATPRPDGEVIPEVVTVAAKVDLPARDFAQEIPGVDDVKIDMVYVAGGEFLMGSPDAEAGRKPDEGPQRKVRVKPYFLAKFELTWAQYYAFWKDQSIYVKGAEPPEVAEKIKPDAITRPTNSYVDELYDHGREGHPALCMSHHAAMMYCRWLQWKTKRGYRLPTEAEWEFAARAGTTGPYSFDEKAGKLDDYAWYEGNSKTNKDTDGGGAKGDAGEPTTHVVGRKKPNALGLYDLHGNVWEWCLDQYDPKGYEKLPADRASLGGFTRPTPDVKWGHPVRGGSYADKPDRLRSAARRVSEPIWIKDDPQGLSSIWWLTRMDVIGMRVCLPVEEYPELVGVKPSLFKKPEPDERGIRKRVKE